MSRRIHCPACGRTDVRLSFWTGRVVRHTGRAIGEQVFCLAGGRKTRGRAS